MYAKLMSKPVNHKMIKLEDVLQVLENMRRNKDNHDNISVIDHIEKQVRKLDTKPRLVIINGGKHE